MHKIGGFRAPIVYWEVAFGCLEGVSVLTMVSGLRDAALNKTGEVSVPDEDELALTFLSSSLFNY